ncbi:hypothetical protein PsorP6_013621 [Peronosclerospora sorghi]|uniref:Uncharacterized protein n=1 Tax=Peronosclerospora sorghi TaxID=230839 RepID=A0ACC0VG11_9STRA|nr:hypothetical protein PsorP6_013621 [Peronosclerospora sorghi]
MGQQSRQIGELTAAHNEARWGWFAKEEPSREQEAGHALSPPTKQERKRDFMDSSMVYERRIMAINETLQTKIFACIKQATLMRLCECELFWQLSEVTE